MHIEINSLENNSKQFYVKQRNCSRFITETSRNSIRYRKIIRYGKERTICCQHAQRNRFTFTWSGRGNDGSANEYHTTLLEAFARVQGISKHQQGRNCYTIAKHFVMAILHVHTRNSFGSSFFLHQALITAS